MEYNIKDIKIYINFNIITDIKEIFKDYIKIELTKINNLNCDELNGKCHF